MKRSDIKKIIKPIVKECINELLLQKEGVLAAVVSEVSRGLQQKQNKTPITEIKKNNNEQETLELEKKYEQERQERIKRLNESAGHDFFKGTVPTPRSESSSASPLSGTDPHDPGVDIKKLMAVAGNRWKKHTK
jgi:hypothetical protein